MNITEDYVSYEVAKLLKEKGFDEPCIAVYEEEVLRINTLCEYYNSELSSYVCAPTHQMAMKWLREEKHFYIEIRRSATYLYGAILIKDGAIDFSRISNIYETHEEAVEAALKYCLENLI